ncbi:MAG: undecaprenyl-diphosphatase, partial [Gammaproteobacteria bacterium]|nr:undecaprenyl-diphosphatase [Gammaproteobacteria bacterium]
LLPRLLGWDDQGLEMDVAAHLGTLCAVIYYFRKELKDMIAGTFNSRFDITDPQCRYLYFLILATLPIAVTGLVGSDIVATQFRNPVVIATATMFFAILLWVADHYGKKT